jgi:hypothetical protein
VDKTGTKYKFKHVLCSTVSHHVRGQASLSLVVQGVRVIRAVPLAEHSSVQQAIQLGHCGPKVEVSLSGYIR